MNDLDRDREFLLSHARSPQRVGEILNADGKGECHNPLCGDRVAVSFSVEDGLLKSVRIRPSGCSISVASASLMAQMMEGQPINEVHSLIKEVNETFSPKNFKIEWSGNLKTLSPLKRIRENPLKIPCVLISWIAMKEAMESFKDSTKH